MAYNLGVAEIMYIDCSKKHLVTDNVISVFSYIIEPEKISQEVREQNTLE